MLPDFVHVGAPKVASTWLWQVCLEHPGIYVPDRKPVNFFVADYHMGVDWYQETYFSGHAGEPVVGELSNGYMVYEPAMERMARHLPDAKITMLAREPIERSFVHWGHLQMRRRFAPQQLMDLEQVFNRGGFLYYMMYLGPSHYAMQLERIWRYFPQENVRVFFYDDLVADPATFLDSYFAFIGAEQGFRPTILHTPTGYPSPEHPAEPELARGIDPDLRQRLRPLVRDDILKLQAMTGRDLTRWLED